MNTAPYPDNDSSEWVIEFIEQPRIEDNLLQFSYAVYASQSSKDGGDLAFLYNSHKAQARPNHQRIKTNSDETMSHVSGLTVKPEELDDFMVNADEAYRWQVGDHQLLTNWQDDRGRELLPFHFPSYNGVNQALDPQWARERFRIEQDEHVRHLIWDKYFPSVIERRLSGDHRGTTLDLQVGASADDHPVEWKDSTSAWFSYGTDGGLGHQFFIGYINADRQKAGLGCRFTGVTMAQGATVSSCYLTVTAKTADSYPLLDISTRIVGEDTDDAAAFSSLASYQARRGTAVGGANNDNRTSASVDWDAVPTFSVGVEYNSPSIVTVIQEIVNRGGWSSGNDMVFWWDDHEARSYDQAGVRRWLHGYDSSTSECVQIHIEFVNPTTAALTGTMGSGYTEQNVRNA